jgi:hypothetical protein
MTELETLSTPVTEIKSSSEVATHRCLATPRKVRRHGSFPADVFPAEVQTLLESVVESKAVPVDYPGVAALVVAGSMIGNCRELPLKADWSERPAFNAVIVGRPGDCKTHSMKPFVKPVQDLQNAVIDAENAKDLEPGLRYWVDNTTVESLARTLARSPNGVLLYRDEIMAWLNSHDEYKGGKGTDRQFYLSCWSQEPAVVDRVGLGGKPINLKEPFVSVLGSIQPDKLKHFAGACAHQDGDGFLHRILWVYPEPVEEEGIWTDAELSPEQAAKWRLVVERLVDLRSHGRRTVRFSDAGKVAWRDWYEMHVGYIDDTNRGVWKKLVSYCARFALVLHYLDLVTRPDYVPGGDEGSISAETVRRAAKLVEYFKKTAHKVYGDLAKSEGDKAVEKLVEYLRKQPGMAQRLPVIQRNVRLVRHPERTKIRDVRRVCQLAADQFLGSFVILRGKDEECDGEGFRLFPPDYVEQLASEDQTDFESDPLDDYNGLSPSLQKLAKKYHDLPDDFGEYDYVAN